VYNRVEERPRNDWDSQVQKFLFNDKANLKKMEEEIISIRQK
jgi:hypothetical protein